MIAADILGVIYAPHKAFKRIIQEPKYLGVIIILAIFVIAQVGSAYIVGQRTFLEQTKPSASQKDIWTENVSWWNASAGVSITNNVNDYLNASAYYGQTSIQFTSTNISSIQIGISNFNESVDCGPNGYRNVSLRVKMIAPSVALSSVSLFLISLDSSSFNRDLTSIFSNAPANQWYNLTIPLNTAEWVSSGAGASWENITGLRLEFTWATASNVDLRLDGLFFRGIFKNALETDATGYLSQMGFGAVTQFVFMWIILSGVMYLIIKGLKGNATWKPLTVAVGFALVIMIIQTIIQIIVYSAVLPNIYYPFELLAGVPGEFQIALTAFLSNIAFVDQVNAIIQLAIYSWTAVLGSFIVREITAFSWSKSIIVAVGSVLLTIIIIIVLSMI